MEKILHYLEQLDLSELEAKIYLTLLETGPISVRDVANRIKIKRTTTYLYIEELMQKGLITKVTTGSKTKITAADPETGLQQLVKEKVEKAKNIEQKFPGILQNIDEAFPKMENTGNAEIKYYKGKLGVRKIYEDALKAKELRSYLNCEILKEFLPENEELFLEVIKNNKNIKIFEIFQDTPGSRNQAYEFQKQHNNSQTYNCKFLPTGVELSASDVLIYEGNVAIINVRNQITGVVFNNAEYYKNSKELFDLIWRILPETHFK